MSTPVVSVVAPGAFTAVMASAMVGMQPYRKKRKKKKKKKKKTKNEN